MKYVREFRDPELARRLAEAPGEVEDAQVGILVVIAEPEVNIGLVRLEIKNAISKLNNQEAVY